jgi:hypothetical protein
VIQVSHIERASALPRAALHADGRVWVVDDEDRIHAREVEVLRVEGESIVVGKGLESGERVVVSPLAATIDGMQVRVVGSAGVGHAGAPEPAAPALPGARS